MSRKKPKPRCLNCGKEVERRPNVYCCNKCQQDWQYKQYINDWLNGTKTGEKGIGQLSRYVRRYLEEKYQQCDLCKTSKSWNSKDLVLIADHIDGDSTNNSPENLRLICPNCDSQLPTFKARNKGNGRYYRRQRYEQGKSY